MIVVAGFLYQTRVWWIFLACSFRGWALLTSCLEMGVFFYGAEGVIAIIVLNRHSPNHYY